MKSFCQFTYESVIDPEQPGLSPQIFDRPQENDPTLKSEVQEYLLYRISQSLGMIGNSLQVVLKK
jgi:hypothetical protein